MTSSRSPGEARGEEWRSTREQVLERDGYECQFCGVTEEAHQERHDRGLAAHHIIPESDGGSDDPENLLTVCQSCHRTLESTHARAVEQMRNEDDAADLEEVEKIWRNRWNDWEEYDEQLCDFIDRHPVFSKEIGAYDEGGAARAQGLEAVTRSRRGGAENIDSELRFAAAFGYREAVADIVSTLDGHTSIPWGFTDEGDE